MSPVRPGGTLSAVVLAAGAATRFGGPKQLAIVEGAPLVWRAAAMAQGLCPGRTVVVTGAHAAATAGALAGLGVVLAQNLRWAEGLASSLNCGLDALPPDTDACLVLLADQPAVSAADLNGLRAAWALAPHQPAAAHYNDVLGVPAIFPRSAWPALRALTGDQGARRLLATLPGVTAAPMPGALLDIDTPADLAR